MTNVAENWHLNQIEHHLVHQLNCDVKHIEASKVTSACTRGPATACCAILHALASMSSPDGLTFLS